MIKIFRPQISETNTAVRLQAVFEINGNKNILWYETEKEYGNFLTYERADAFVVGLLWYALKKKHDIHVLAPISERLYYSINKYISPVMAQMHGYKVRVYSEELISEPLPSAGAVGTGLSCGIDSFSTILEHMKDDVPENYKITHFTFFNVGSHKSFGGKKAFDLFTARTNFVKACADELGKALITVDSNLSDILKMWFGPTNTFRSVSGVLALQKLFKTYYYSSAVHIKDFKLTKGDSASYDIFNLPMLSTESTTLFSSCTDLTRVEKTRKVADFPLSEKYLNVCFNQAFNCGGCAKCLRTLLTLELIGALDKYKALFNLDNYYKKRRKYIAFIRKNYRKDSLYQEIYDEMLRIKFIKKPKKRQRKIK